jgi:hypothetical protein
MPKKQNPDPRKIDWAEFVEARRLDELRRQHCRPSQMLHRHSQTWREPYTPKVPKWLGGPWLIDEERAAFESVRANIAARMARLTRKR